MRLFWPLLLFLFVDGSAFEPRRAGKNVDKGCWVFGSGEELTGQKLRDLANGEGDFDNSVSFKEAKDDEWCLYRFKYPENCRTASEAEEIGFEGEFTQKPNHPKYNYLCHWESELTVKCSAASSSDWNHLAPIVRYVSSLVLLRTEHNIGVKGFEQSNCTILRDPVGPEGNPDPSADGSQKTTPRSKVQSEIGSDSKSNINGSGSNFFSSNCFSTSFIVVLVVVGVILIAAIAGFVIYQKKKLRKSAKEKKTRKKKSGNTDVEASMTTEASAETAKHETDRSPTIKASTPSECGDDDSDKPRTIGGHTENDSDGEDDLQQLWQKQNENNVKQTRNRAHASKLPVIERLNIRRIVRAAMVGRNMKWEDSKDLTKFITGLKGEHKWDENQAFVAYLAMGPEIIKVDGMFNFIISHGIKLQYYYRYQFVIAARTFPQEFVDNMYELINCQVPYDKYERAMSKLSSAGRKLLKSEERKLVTATQD